MGSTTTGGCSSDALLELFIIWAAIMFTCVLYLACTLRLILNISRISSSLPWRTSNSFHICQNAEVTWDKDLYWKQNCDTYILQLVDCECLQTNPRIADLTAVDVDCSGSVHFAQFCFHIREAQAHVSSIVIRQHIYRFLINFTRLWNAVNLRSFFDVDIEHLQQSHKFSNESPPRNC